MALTMSPWPFEKLGERFKWHDSQSRVVESTSEHVIARLYDLRDGTFAMVKVFQKLSSSGPEVAELLHDLWHAESRSLMRLRGTSNNAIVRLLAAEHDVGNNTYFIAWEDYYNATLRNVLDPEFSVSGWPKSLIHRVEAATALVSALRDMHALGIIHRDIRPETVCVWPDLERVALAQFGQSLFVNQLLHVGFGKRTGDRISSASLSYAAPERCAYLTDSDRVEAVGEGLQGDIYSLGITFAEWMVGFASGPPSIMDAESLYDHDKHRQWILTLQDKIRAHEFIEDTEIQQNLRDLLAEMIAFDVRDRFSAVGHLCDRWTRLRDKMRRRDLPQISKASLHLVIHDGNTQPHVEPVYPDLYMDSSLSRLEVNSRIRAKFVEDLTEQPIRVVPDAEGRPDWCLLVGRQFAYNCMIFKDNGSPLPHLLMLQKLYPAGPPERLSLEAGAELLLSNLKVLSLTDRRSRDHVNKYKIRSAGASVDWLVLLERIRQVTGASQTAAEAPERATTVEALRQLLKLRNLERYVQTYGYRVVRSTAAPPLIPSDPGGEATPATEMGQSLGDATSSPLVFLAPDESLDESLREHDPLLGVFSKEFEDRRPLDLFVRDLAFNGGSQGEIVLGDQFKRLTERGGAVKAIVDAANTDIASGEVCVRLTNPLNAGNVPALGWLRPLGAFDTTKQERDATDRLAMDDFMIDALMDPAKTATTVSQSLLLPKARGGTSHLAPSKIQCLEDAVKSHPVYVLKGPPGTGKTETVAALLHHIFNENPAARVLICSQAHRPLDNLLERVSKQHNRLLVLRMASGRSDGVVGPLNHGMSILIDDVRARVVQEALVQVKKNLAHLTAWQEDIGADPDDLSSILVPWSEQLEKYQAPEYASSLLAPYLLRGASVVGATCIGAAKLVDKNLPPFDWIVIEEAARAHPTELLVPFTLGDRWFLVGDHEQLGPYRGDRLKQAMSQMLSCVPDGGPQASLMLEAMDKFSNLFAYLYDSADDDQRGEILECFRMHPSLVDLLNHVIYDNRLLSSVSAEDRQHPYAAEWESEDFLQGNAVVVFDTQDHRARREAPDSGTSKWNPLEVELVVRFLRRIWPQVVKRISARFGREPTEEELTESVSEEVAVLAIYAEQRKRLRAALAKCELPESIVHTVTSFQGREANLVLLSLTRSNEYTKPYTAVGAMSRAPELNVALSRARELLVVCGDLQHFATNRDDLEVIHRLLEWLDGNAVIGSIDALVEPTWQPVREAP